MLGLCTGLIVHSSAVALGVAVIFQTSAVAFSALKFIGAGYLVYLAWQAFRASAHQIQSIALLAGTLGQWLNRSDRAQNILNKIAGTVFLGLALKLATTER